MIVTPSRAIRGKQTSGDGDGALFAAGNGQHGNLGRQEVERGVEVALTGHRQQLGLVGEQDIDMLFDQPEKVGAMTINAERIGQTEGHAPAGCMSDFSGFLERLLGPRPVP